MPLRRTKIVCTIGPTTNSVEMIAGLIEAGMDVARLNFSYSTKEEHGGTIDSIRELSGKMKRPVAILQDLCGPKIRVGHLCGEVCLEEGDEILLVSGEVLGDGGRLSVSYPHLAEDVKPGEPIFIDEGTIALEALRPDRGGLRCRVERGGKVVQGKGVNFPKSSLRVDPLTPKDVEDLLFGISKGVDFVALSFVRRADDIARAKELIASRGSNIPVIAKIEKGEALGNLEEIVAAADGVMVARGDLGIEVDLEEVPIAQKRIIRLCNRLGKPVITATQMLDSMRSKPYPTRAEVSDVANAIFDGTDAVMLSQETAVGDYPLESLRMMSKVALKAESAIDYGVSVAENVPRSGAGIADAISHATCQAARDLDVAAIITPTTSGSTARMVARYRPRAPIVAVSLRKETVRRLSLSWGVYPFEIPQVRDTDEMVERSIEIALREGFVRKGDRVVVTAGVPLNVPGTTNLLKVEEV